MTDENEPSLDDISNKESDSGTDSPVDPTSIKEADTHGASSWEADEPIGTISPSQHSEYDQSEDDQDEYDCECKISKGINRYGAHNLIHDIPSRYIDEDDSLRDLERYINIEFTRRALGMIESPIVTDALRKSFTDNLSEYIVETLRYGDDASAAEKTQIKTELEDIGIDVSELQKTWVSFRTVKKHLNECLDIDTSREETQITRQEAFEAIDWGRRQAEGITQRTLNRLANAGHINVSDDLDITVVERVRCEECGASMTVSELIRENGCECLATTSVDTDTDTGTDTGTSGETGTTTDNPTHQ